jgi:diguanylate cyclase (GGDEF)-like protein
VNAVPKSTVFLLGSEPETEAKLQSHLRTMGYQVETVVTLEDADLVLGSKRAAAVLVDASLGEAGVLSVVEWRRERGTPCPVVLIARESEQAICESAALAGVDELLRLPIDPVELYVRMSSLARVTATASVEAERTRFETLLDQQPVAWMVVDERLDVERVNRAMVHLLAAGGPGRLWGVPFSALSEEGAELLRSMIEHNGCDVDVEVPLLRRDGQRIQASLSARRLRSEREVKIQVVIRDVSEATQYQRDLEREVFGDATTQLPNRALLLDRLQMALSDAMRVREGAAIAVIGLDRLSVFKDAFGAQASREILDGFAELLRRSIRPDETAARLGPEEFALVLRGFENSHQVVTRCRAILKSLTSPLKVAGHVSPMNPSVGVACFPRDSTIPEELLRDAAIASRSARAEGGGLVRFYAPDMEARSQQRLDLERRLRQAMQHDSLALHYQPKVSLGSRIVCGAEALLRWTDAERGAVPPNELIPLAEETDLILGLGEWVVRRVCTVLSDRTRLGFTDVPIAINVSARQFQAVDVPALIQRALSDSRVNPELLHVEITEGLLMHDSGRTLHDLTALRSMGVKIALDDFGHGYHSLRALKKLPLDFVKIDDQFVRGLQEDDRDQAIVESVVRMSHRLGFRVIAEGVETASQARFLQEAGCDEAQGYYFARPIDEPKFSRFMPCGAPQTRRPSGLRGRVPTRAWHPRPEPR